MRSDHRAGSPPATYLITDGNELDEFQRAMRRRGISILYMVAKVMKGSVEDVFHQGVLEFEEGNRGT